MITPSNLSTAWNLVKGKRDVIAFYSHKSNYYPQFSNFWIHDTIDFKIPGWCGMMANSYIQVNSSEKAIMLCKASLFNDKKTFDLIKKTNNPLNAKRLGRKSKFDQAVWDKYVCKIAKYAICNKFSSIPSLRSLILTTNNCFIAEASKYDKIWGIGMYNSNKNCNYPSKWNGCNILGWALMETRLDLRRNRYMDRRYN